MKNAEVVIELDGLDGDVLTATCTAVFEMVTDASAPSEGQTLLVAFPLTMNAEDAVKITDFELTIDGVQKAEIQPRLYVLSDTPIDLSRLFSGGAPNSVKALEMDLRLGDLFGYRIWDNLPANGPVISRAYAWQQTFLPGSNCVIQIKYRMMLYAQSLAYSKEYRKGQSRDVVPFDLMLAGTSEENAFFLDYILRSGSTWQGPIGHEVVILRAAKDSGIVFKTDNIVTVGRHRFEGASEDLRESTLFSRAGIHPWSIAKREDAVVWSITNEDPQQDIMVQIPLSAVRNTTDQKD